jgi:hypothetical protein
MTLFDVAVLFDYWREYPTTDDILKAVYKVETSKPEPEKKLSPNDPSGIGGLIAGFRASQPLIRRNRPFAAVVIEHKFVRVSIAATAEHIEAFTKYMRIRMFNIIAVVSKGANNSDHCFDFCIRLAKITLLFQFVWFLESRVWRIRIPHNIRGSENA